jgi:phage gpG-like protein
MMDENINWSEIQSKLTAVMRSLPRKMGTIIVNFSKDRFRAQMWVDTTYQPWPRRKKTKKKSDQGRALLIKSGRLRRSVRIISTTSNSVTVGSDVPYAAVHNEGFNGVVSISGHVRKNVQKRAVYSIITKKKSTRRVSVGEYYVKPHNRNMNIPKRQYMGNSMMQTRLIEDLITKEILNAFK